MFLQLILLQLNLTKELLTSKYLTITISNTKTLINNKK